MKQSIKYVMVQKNQQIRNLRTEKAPQLFFINILTKIANEKGIARRVVFGILQDSNTGC